MGQPVGDHELNNGAALSNGIHEHQATHAQTLEKEEKKNERITSSAVAERAERLGRWRRSFARARRFDERIKLLIAFGLTDHDVATAVPNAKTRSVRRWRTEAAPTKRIAGRWEPVDDLCAIISFFLADGSYDEESIVSWLRSRQLELGGKRRPLEAIREGHFDAVLEAAESALSSSVADEDELLPLPRKAKRDLIPARHRSDA